MMTLLYRSDSVRLLPDSEIADIFFKSHRNNQTYGITGFLIEYEGTFIQIIEGDKDNVDTIYNKIESDCRHENIKILIKDEVKVDRMFDFWGMNFGLMDYDFLNSPDLRNARDPVIFSRLSYDPVFCLRVLSRAYAHVRVMSETNPFVKEFLETIAKSYH